MIGLLLKILSLYRETKISREEEEPVKELDLGLLKPLWKLYYTILGEVGGCTHCTLYNTASLATRDYNTAVLGHVLPVLIYSTPAIYLCMM